MKRTSAETGFITIPLHSGDKKRLNLTRDQITVIAGITYYLIPTEEPDEDIKAERVMRSTDRQEQRHRKCLIKNERGELVRCRMSCKNCSRENRSSFVSLDELSRKKPDFFIYEEFGYEDVDNECTYDAVMSKLADINPVYADSLDRYYRGDGNIAKLAREEGVAKSTMFERLQKAIKLVKLIYDGEL